VPIWFHLTQKLSYSQSCDTLSPKICGLCAYAARCTTSCLPIKLVVAFLHGSLLPSRLLTSCYQSDILLHRKVKFCWNYQGCVLVTRSYLLCSAKLMRIASPRSPKSSNSTLYVTQTTLSVRLRKYSTY
jgi:hypothetical protein